MSNVLSCGTCGKSVDESARETIFVAIKSGSPAIQGIRTQFCGGMCAASRLRLVAESMAPAITGEKVETEGKGVSAGDVIDQFMGQVEKFRGGKLAEILPLQRAIQASQELGRGEVEGKGVVIAHKGALIPPKGEQSKPSQQKDLRKKGV